MPTPKKDPKDYKKTGRPERYTPELAEKVCYIIATHAHGLKKLCAMYDFMPDKSIIFSWIQSHPEFYDQYLRARRFQSHVVADEILDMSSEVQSYVDKDLVERIDSGILGRAKFAMECKKWHASKLEPKIYGDNKIENQEIKDESTHKEAMERKRVLEEENKKEY